MFVQLEKGQYTSRATPVDVNDLLVRSLVGSGRLQSSIRERLKLDVTVLKLTLDEVRRLLPHKKESKWGPSEESNAFGPPD